MSYVWNDEIKANLLGIAVSVALAVAAYFFLFKDDQPTYSEASIPLGVIDAASAHDLKNLARIGARKALDGGLKVGLAYKIDDLCSAFEKQGISTEDTGSVVLASSIPKGSAYDVSLETGAFVRTEVLCDRSFFKNRNFAQYALTADKNLRLYLDNAGIKYSYVVVPAQ